MCIPQSSGEVYFVIDYTKYKFMYGNFLQVKLLLLFFCLIDTATSSGDHKEARVG
jgi:hypothetical protein